MTEILFKGLSFKVVGAAIEAHRLLSPGFLESVYQTSLEHEFELQGIPFKQQKRLTIKYKDIALGDYIAELRCHVFATASGGSVINKKIRENW